MKEVTPLEILRFQRRRDYYKQLYTDKFDNLDKMDKLIERYKLSK